MMRRAAFLYAAAPDRAPPHPEPVEGFPSSARLIEMNRQAAAEAFSGYLPRMILTLVASLMAATACVMLVVELYQLDARLAGC